MNIRAAAARVLAPVIRGEQSLQQHFDGALDKIEGKDRALFHELVYGTLRHYEVLHSISKALVDKLPRNKDADILALILLGLYQITHLRIPDHAALSETVAASKALKKVWAKNLINAVLRRYLREQETLNTQHQRPCLPDWLLSHVQNDWPQQCADICQQSLLPAPITLRANRHQTHRDTLISVLNEQGIESQACTHADDGLRLNDSSDLRRIDEHLHKHFSVQDEAAQLAAPLMMLTAGQRVLDACAAPGGKSTHILEHSKTLALTALEIDEKRSQRIRDNLSRLDLKATILCADACQTDDWWDGQRFDRILLDAPCSATGIIRRHPDIKLLRRPSDLAKLNELQQRLLQQLWPCLSPGGILLYATCSLLKCENVDQMRVFLANTSDAEEVPIDAEWGIAQDVGRQLLPQAQGHDGFYYARIKKRLT